MTDTLGWLRRGEQFADGSSLADWQKVYQSETWHWQYDTHELTYAIYAHDGQFWKLYHSRFVAPGDTRYTNGYGGVACRVVEVRYLITTKSPHSSLLKAAGDLEWIRTYEFDPALHEVIRAGEQSAKYGLPYGQTAEAVST